MYKHFGAQNQSGDVTYYLDQAFSSSTSFTHPFWTNLEEKLNKQKFRENIIHSSSSIRPTIVITIVVTVVLVCNVKWEVEGEHRSRFCLWKFFFEFACSENNCWATTAAAAVGPKNLKKNFNWNSWFLTDLAASMAHCYSPNSLQFRGFRFKSPTTIGLISFVEWMG